MEVKIVSTFNVSVDLINNNSYCELIEILKGSEHNLAFNFNSSMFKRRVKLTIKTPNNKYLVYDIQDFGNFRIPSEASDTVGEHICVLDVYYKETRKTIKPFSYWIKPLDNNPYLAEIDSLVDRVEQLKSDTLSKAKIAQMMSTGTGFTNCWYDGAGLPDDTFGNNGDYYLKLPEGDIYNKVFGGWERIGNIAGPEGLPGKTGPQGPQGLQGEQGLRGYPGLDGKSAYEVWLSLGNKGTEEDFINSIVKGQKGDKGDKGDTGPQGEQGERGLQGPQGIQGIQGQKGDDGYATVWYDGSGLPQVEVGKKGDYYLDIITFDIYKKELSHWERIGNIAANIKELAKIVEDLSNRVGILENERVVIERGSYFEFPNVGDINCLYVDIEAGETYAWDERINSYQCIGTSSEKIELIYGGGA